MLSLQIFVEWMIGCSFERLQNVSVILELVKRQNSVYLSLSPLPSKVTGHQMPDRQLEQNCKSYNVVDFPHLFHFLTLLQGGNAMFGFLLHLLPPRCAFLWQWCFGSVLVLRVGLLTCAVLHRCLLVGVCATRNPLGSGPRAMCVQEKTCPQLTRKSKVLLSQKNNANYSSL